MTKSITIINSDTSDWNVKVITQQLHTEGWVEVTSNGINNPGQSITVLIHTGQRIIIEEDGNTEYAYYPKEYIKNLEKRLLKDAI